MQLPIEHLSYSAMRMFCSNPWQFKKNYILGLWDNKSSVTALVGKGFHKFADLHFKGMSVDAAKSEAIKLMDSVPDNAIDFGKTGSREQALKDLSGVIEYFLQEKPRVGDILGTEISLTTGFELNDVQAPLPLKAITDCASRMENKLWGHDWKVVHAFSDADKEKGLFIIQAMFNYFTLKAKFKENPYGYIFWEIKKSRNKSGDPQIQPYQIIFEQHPEYFSYFGRMYTGMVRALANPDFVFLPNFSDTFTAEESWADFAAEVMDFEMPKQVSHKSPLMRNVEDVSFVESLSTAAVGDNLTQADLIRSKLLEFAMPVEMVDEHRGANVTMHRLKPSRGVGMKKMSAFGDDLALALGAKSVRIEAPLRGTKYVGIEVSNEKQEIVPWTEELLTPQSLVLPVGTDVYGVPCKLDLARAPHLLVAGTTGSGKSVGLNVFIQSLMRQNSPESLKLVLIDPKRTEFAQFAGAPHVNDGLVITEAEDAVFALEWAVNEMEERYKLLQASKVRNIDEYNKSGYMHKIVIVIDELADLMLSGHRDRIENNIVRLAQKSRASGIHMIAATQRPSVDVVTGILKANFPTRISFMVATKVDSQVILDQPGAEQLIGNGDLLLMNPSEKGLLRLQGYFINEN